MAPKASWRYTESRFAAHALILPPNGNPLRDEVDVAARAEHVELRVPIEVEGIRLIADLVASGAGVSILPETAVPDDHPPPALPAAAVGRGGPADSVTIEPRSPGGEGGG